MFSERGNTLQQTASYHLFNNRQSHCNAEYAEYAFRLTCTHKVTHFDTVACHKLAVQVGCCCGCSGSDTEGVGGDAWLLQACAAVHSGPPA